MGTTHEDSGSFAFTRNQPGVIVSDSRKTNALSNSPKQETGIKNKRVFIDNTVDSILHSKQTKTSSFMNKPVGPVPGTGTTEVLPKVHSESPRGNFASGVASM